MSNLCTKNCNHGSFDILSRFLADTYSLLLKTHNVHWNVVGSGFGGIHSMTENHYENLFKAVDDIAERIRMIGCIAPATFEEFSKIATISDKLSAKNAKDMINELLKDHRTIVSNLKKWISELSDSQDFATVDLLTDRLGYHEKIVWMLSAMNE
jgi:starvation-inducible DNA-binding protein